MSDPILYVAFFLNAVNIWLVIANGIDSMKMRKELIKRELAEYDRLTAKLVWKSDRKEIKL